MKKDNRMHLKKQKKKSKLKIILMLLVIYLSFSYTFYYCMQNNKNISNEKFVSFLLKGGNSNLLYEIKLNNMVNDTMKYLLNIDIRTPKTLLTNSFISSDKKLEIEHNDDYSNLDKLKEISSYIEDPNPVDIDKPVVYLYNSHQLENYSNANLEIYGITPNVLMASYLLKEKLNEKGVSTIVEDTDLTNFLAINGWDYSYSYKASRVFILEKQTKYDSLKYYIDIHRDSVSKKNSTTTIDNKSYAKVLFVVGLEHDNYQANLDLANKVNGLIEKHYPGLSKGILKKEGAGVNGIYNQDLSSGSMLIEVGGYENTIEEVLNTMEALSKVIKLLVNE